MKASMLGPDMRRVVCQKGYLFGVSLPIVAVTVNVGGSSRYLREAVEITRHGRSEHGGHHPRLSA